MTSTAAVILQATNFAAERHRHQRRKDKEATPYINHPIEVAHLLAAAGVDDIDILVAALLHDTVEDTKTSLDEIRELFGQRVARIVEECTDDKKLSKIQRKQVQLAKTNKVSTEAKWVKLADKLANIRDLVANPPPQWSPQEVHGYLAWTAAIHRQLEGLSSYFDEAFAAVFGAAKLTRDQINETELQAKVEAYYQHIDKSD